jgi:hypothetical protein
MRKALPERVERLSFYLSVDTFEPFRAGAAAPELALPIAQTRHEHGVDAERSGIEQGDVCRY